jgi:hypothetical protein
LPFLVNFVAKNRQHSRNSLWLKMLQSDQRPTPKKIKKNLRNPPGAPFGVVKNSPPPFENPP